MRLCSCRSVRCLRGFTWIEVLVVLAVVAIMATLTIPSLQGVLSSGNLNASADSVLGELGLARQTAAARGTPVDVRLYQDLSRPRDANGNYPYRVIAIVVPAGAGSAAGDEFLTAPLALSGDVAIESNPQQSTVLNTALGTAGQQPVAGTELPTAPSAVRNLPYVQFIYLANGTIALDPSQPWCLTLDNQNKSHTTGANGALDANFVALALDVQTGRVRTYRP